MTKGHDFTLHSDKLTTSRLKWKTSSTGNKVRLKIKNYIVIYCSFTIEYGIKEFVLFLSFFYLTPAYSMEYTILLRYLGKVSYVYLSS